MALSRLRPMLEVNDMATTISFWTEQLGFTLTASMAESDGSPPFWCNLTRDAVAVMFSWEAEHTHDDGEVHRSTAALGGSLYLDVEDVDALAEELRARGVLGAGEEAIDRPHGMREFGLTDPNGFHLVFGQPI